MHIHKLTSITYFVCFVLCNHFGYKPIEKRKESWIVKRQYKKSHLDAWNTQIEVAEKLVVAQAQYARWENEGRNTKDETVERLVEFFGVSFDYLKGRDDGLEEIVYLLRQYDLTDRMKIEILGILSEYLED